jgi:hypothetical protein
MVVLFSYSSPTSLMSCFSYISFFVHWQMAMYSASY